MPRLIATLLLLSSTTASALTVPDHFTSFWVLGDSFSDPGNVFAATGGTTPTSPPYFQGRFSNGPVWAEYVGEAFTDAGKPVGNFAFGGATAVPNGDAVPDLDAQLFVLSGEVASFGARPLAGLWIGGNDVLGSSDPESDAIAAAAAVGDGMESLAALGFGDILLFDLPPNAPSAPVYNAQLATEVSQIRAAGVTVYEIDTADVIQGIALDLSTGITELAQPCLGFTGQTLTSICTPEEANQRLLFDDVHPSAGVHTYVAEVAAAQLTVVPLPGAMGALLLGVASLGWAGRRRAK